MVIIVFGLPGAGKTFVGNIIAKNFGWHLHDADVDLPDEMRLIIQQNGMVTEEMRDMFFQNILESLDRLESTEKNIVVAQTFIKEKYREWVHNKFPDAKFLFIVTPNDIREKRLSSRTDYPLDLVYSRQMVANFDQPKIPCMQIDNAVDGEEHVKEQLNKILNQV